MRQAVENNDATISELIVSFGGCRQKRLSRGYSTKS